jgi:hypothetical protein
LAYGSENNFFFGNENIRMRLTKSFPRTEGRNENVRTRITNVFPAREQTSRKVALVALMMRYVSLVAESHENLSGLLVYLIQISHVVLLYF